MVFVPRTAIDDAARVPAECLVPIATTLAPFTSIEAVRPASPVPAAVLEAPAVGADGVGAGPELQAVAAAARITSPADNRRGSGIRDNDTPVRSRGPARALSDVPQVPSFGLGASTSAVAQLSRRVAELESAQAVTAGGMFWFTRNRLVGSYFALIIASRT